MPGDQMDEIDQEILQILTQDPRMPYSEIADQLDDVGLEMSAEGVRRRVSRLFDESSIFLLTGPQGLEYEVIRVDVTVTDDPGATEAVFDRMAEDDFWLVCRGFGTIDVHAVATIEDVEDANDLVNEIRSFEEVDTIEYFLETDRKTDMRQYMLK